MIIQWIYLYWHFYYIQYNKGDKIKFKKVWERMNLYVNGAESAVCMLFLSLRKMSTSEFVISLSRKVSHSLREIMRMAPFILLPRPMREWLLVCRVRENLLMESLYFDVNSWSMTKMERRVAVFMSFDHRFAESLDWILEISRKDAWISKLVKISGFFSDIFYWLFCIKWLIM